MKKLIALFILIVFSLCLTACNSKDSMNARLEFSVEDTLEEVENTTAKVILLFGQSNATGVAGNSYLSLNDPDTYSKASNGYNIKINYITENGGNTSNDRFVNVKLGQGANNSYYGPEIGIADYLTSNNKDENVFIIKYSWGGIFLHSQWFDKKHNRGELYNASLNFTLASLNYLRSKGYNIEIEAICWMQGESDAVYKRYARNYYKNTVKLIEYYREDLKEFYKDNLLFIDAGILEIETWPYSKIVNDAKRRVSSLSDYNIYFNTTEMNLTSNYEPEGSPDLAHYDSMSMLELGRKFASFIK